MSESSWVYFTISLQHVVITFMICTYLWHSPWTLICTFAMQCHIVAWVYHASQPHSHYLACISTVMRPSDLDLHFYVQGQLLLVIFMWYKLIFSKKVVKGKLWDQHCDYTRCSFMYIWICQMQPRLMKLYENYDLNETFNSCCTSTYSDIWLKGSSRRNSIQKIASENYFVHMQEL